MPKTGHDIAVNLKSEKKHIYMGDASNLNNKMIEHDDRLYEIDLSNNIKMTFSSSFRLLDIDK